MNLDVDPSTKSFENLYRALQDPEVVDFERATLLAGYQDYFPDRLPQVVALIEHSLQRLVASQASRPDPQRLAAVTLELLEDVFHKADPAFWFNQTYHHYKTILKPATDLSLLGELIRGQRVLDYGCGSGYLSASLARQGYQVYTTDVLDYRYAEARHLPFVQMRTPTEIGYPAGSLDTVLIQAVLHHINPQDLVQILRSLSRVARWLVIKEDSYGLPPDLPGLAQRQHDQPLLARFSAYDLERQYRILCLIDYFANAVAQGIPEMHMPFEFRTPPEWQQVLAAHGWRLQETRLAGFEPGYMHQSCHLWLVCELTSVRDTVMGAIQDTDCTDQHGFSSL